MSDAPAFFQHQFHSSRPLRNRQQSCFSSNAVRETPVSPNHTRTSFPPSSLALVIPLNEARDSKLQDLHFPLLRGLFVELRLHLVLHPLHDIPGV